MGGSRTRGEGGNVLVRRRDERLARQPEQVRRALEALDEGPCPFQLRVLRRSRAYPEPGETFRLEPPCCPPLEGVVVNSHVDPTEEDAIVVLVFAPGVSPETALSLSWAGVDGERTPFRDIAHDFWAESV